MSTLLVQGCSKSKNWETEGLPAAELYSGFFFKILKKAIRTGEFDSEIDIAVLSAEYGLIDADTEIEPYDRRMDPERAHELRPEVTEALASRAVDVDSIVLNLGKTYRIAVEEFAHQTDTAVYHIDGGGIGEKGHALKRFIRGDWTAVDEFEPQPRTVEH